jgi:hypothetical protein
MGSRMRSSTHFIEDEKHEVHDVYGVFGTRNMLSVAAIIYGQAGAAPVNASAMSPLYKAFRGEQRPRRSRPHPCSAANVLNPQADGRQKASRQRRSSNDNHYQEPGHTA